MTWIKTLVHRPALVTVIYLILFLFGSYSYSKLPIDLLPDMEVPVVTVVTAYPGASALDVRTISTRRFSWIIPTKRLASTSRENLSLVTLIFLLKPTLKSPQTMSVKILKKRVLRDAESPQVLKFDMGQMMYFAITTQVPMFSKNQVECLIAHCDGFRCWIRHAPMLPIRCAH